MLSYLSQYEEAFPWLRLLEYTTFRTLLAAGTALLLGFLVGPWLIDKLTELKLGQAFRDAKEVGKLAELHASKRNTPTMGGLLIYGSVMVGTLLWARPNIWVLTALGVYTGLTALGFKDDYRKVSKKNSKGVSSREKLLWQAVITGLAVTALLLHPQSATKIRELWVPFVKFAVWPQMPVWFLGLFAFVVIAGWSNAINITDGVDGLAIGGTITTALVYAIMAYAAGNFRIAEYLLISHVPGAGELTVLCGALLGAGMAFLWYNCHPAQVFMGDTGSLAIGGLLGVVAFLVHQPLTLLIAGGLFLMEIGSVVLQVLSFKSRGVRIFRMAPIHHHFELGGWKETKVVVRFWILSLLFAMAALATLKLR